MQQGCARLSSPTVRDNRQAIRIQFGYVPAACGVSWLGPLDATTVGQQVLLKGPPVGGGEGRPRISLLKGPPMVGGEGRLLGEVGGKLAATD